MKIVVRNKNERPHHLALFLPLFVIKWKVVARALASNKELMMEAEELHQTIKSVYKELKSFTRRHGHFDLVKVDSHDGTHVRIRV